MPRPVTLESFTCPAQAEAAAHPPGGPLEDEAFEEARLASYEEGYKAGWDDAAAAAEEEGEGLRREALSNLQALSFTFHEARSHLMEGLGPLFDAICDRLLPQLAQAAIGGHLRDTLVPLAGTAMDRPVTLLLNPAARATVEQTLAEGSAPPVDIVEDPSLGAGEVHLRSSTEERRIDLDAALDEIRATLAAHFATPPEDTTAPDTPLEPEESLKHG